MLIMAWFMVDRSIYTYDGFETNFPSWGASPWQKHPSPTGPTDHGSTGPGRSSQGHGSLRPWRVLGRTKRGWNAIAEETVGKNRNHPLDPPKPGSMRSQNLDDIYLYIFIYIYIYTHVCRYIYIYTYTCM